MDFVNPILDILIRLWDCIAKDVNTMRDVEANLKALENALRQLRILSEDVRRRVELEEERQMVRMKQVDSWLQEVEAIERSVNDVLEKASRRHHGRCCFCCQKDCWSSYKLGREVKKKHKLVDKLKNQGSFDSVAHVLPRGPVDERPLEEIVGLISVFQEVWRWIKDEEVKVIGIYGMGGVGKTTLLKKINNEFVKMNHGFDLVIWVVVSKQSSLDKVQDTICEKLKLPESTWKNKSEDEKAVQIFKILRVKKFVLMLDDVWERVDLVKVGVPTSDDQRVSKVLLTTRYEGICGYMEANKTIKVECLAREEALTLFRKKVGSSTLNAHPAIPKLAEVVADECKGLPLALIAVGRAMASKSDPRDWDRVIMKLRKDPSRIMGVDDDVFRILEFSYDSLRDDVMKSCFLYCCIYPEDHEILIDDLLELWIGEGLLDEFDDIHEARNEGGEIIQCLKAASLLENGKSEEYVKMHDVIRDMALWISSGSKAKANMYLVVDHVCLLEKLFVSTAKRVSLWGSSIRNITETSSSSCPNVSTFLARHTAIRMFPSGFLHIMPVLKLLDLSYNFHLSELPSSIGTLVELQFLNLSNTRIRELPVKLKNLRKMKYLLLNATYRMELIPRQVISSFSFLRVFRISGSHIVSPSSENNVLSDGRRHLLDELESLEHLNDISITIFDTTSIQKLEHSSKIQNCLTSLCLEGFESSTSITLLSASVEGMGHLERLDIYYCEIQKFVISSYFRNVRKVYIAYCDNLLDLSWLIHAPTVEFLDVAHCESMLEIVKAVPARVEEAVSVFSRLKKISLINLPNLHSVYPYTLPLPSLVEVHVGSCRRLRRLPFDSRSAQHTLKEIRGAMWWWLQLQWDEESVKPLFQSYFVPEGPIW